MTRSADKRLSQDLLLAMLNNSDTKFTHAPRTS
jgi:hypothetical protein